MKLNDSNSSPTAAIDCGKLTLDKVNEPPDVTTPPESCSGATMLMAPPLVSKLPKVRSLVFKLKDMPDTKVPLLAAVAMVKLLVSDSHAKVRRSADLVTVGYPTGFPSKIATVGGEAAEEEKVIFVTSDAAVVLVKSTLLPDAVPAVKPVKVPENVPVPLLPVAKAVATAVEIIPPAPAVSVLPAIVTVFPAAKAAKVTVAFSVTAEYEPDRLVQSVTILIAASM